MHEHYELWVYSGPEEKRLMDRIPLAWWNKTVFEPKYVGEDMLDVLNRAEAAFAQHCSSMPKCPAKVVWVRAEVEHYGRT